jgi:hypothetical protein
MRASFGNIDWNVSSSWNNWNHFGDDPKKNNHSRQNFKDRYQDDDDDDDSDHSIGSSRNRNKGLGGDGDGAKRRPSKNQNLSFKKSGVLIRSSRFD